MLFPPGNLCYNDWEKMTGGDGMQTGEKRLVRGMSVLVKPASGQCNERCDYCFYRDEAAKRTTASYGMMDGETLRSVLRRTLPRVTEQYSLAFQGGEPTLRGLPFYREAVERVRRLNRNGAQVTLSMQTNGALIDDEWARFFAENGFLLGLSVDGTRALHDAHRHMNDGGSAYEAALRAAEALDRHGVPYNILTVVHRETAARVREIYSEYKARGWRYTQYIACLDPLDEVRGQRAYALTPEAYGEFLSALFDLWYADAVAGQPPYIRQFDNWLGMLLGRPPEACEQCGSCGEQYIVEADGSVFPCDFYCVDAWRLGSFTENTLEEIDARREALGFRQASWALPEKCRTCPYVRLCRNGCRRNRGEDGVSIFCGAYKSFFDRCLPRLTRLAEELTKRRGVIRP